MVTSALWAGDWHVSQVFGVNRAAYERYGLVGHNGFDLGMWNHTELYAPGYGKVRFASTDPGGYGNFVKVTMDDGSEWTYAHLLAFSCYPGQRVYLGMRLGWSDNTGNSTGPHLHIGYRPPGWESHRGNGFDGYVDPGDAIEAAGAAEEEVISPEDQAILDTMHGLNANAASIGEWISAIGAQSEMIAKQAETISELQSAPQGEPVAVRVEVVNSSGRRDGFVPET